MNSIHERGARRRPEGLSLVELMVVVAALGVLCSLLLPSLAEVTFRARNAKSISNLRSIGIVLLAYSADHQGNLPYRIENVVLPGGGTASNLSWHARLVVDGYVKSRDVFFNPKEKYKSWAQFLADPQVDASLKTSTTAWLPVYGLRSASMEPLSLPRIAQPSKFFVMTESWCTATNFPGYFVSSDPAWKVKIDKNGHANTLFADGHVEAREANYFLGLQNTPVEETGGGKYSVWSEP